MGVAPASSGISRLAALCWIALGFAGLLHCAGLFLWYGISTTSAVTGILGAMALCWWFLACRKTAQGEPLLPRRWRRGCAGAAIAGALLGGGALVVMVWDARNPEGREEARCVIVLGAGLRGRELTDTLRNRLIVAANFLRAHPALPVVVSGGQGPREAVSEAQAMRDFLMTQAIAPSRIRLEDRSTSTWENFRFSRALLERDSPALPPILIVSSGFHLSRAKFLARRAGFVCAGLPAATPLPVLLNSYLRELPALVKSFLLDHP